MRKRGCTASPIRCGFQVRQGPPSVPASRWRSTPKTVCAPSTALRIILTWFAAATMVRLLPIRRKTNRSTLTSSLYFGLGSESISLNLISHRPAGEDGYFVLLASPSIEVDESDVASRDVVFVVDVSGSMEGPKLGQAKDAVRYVVEHLNPDDRFNLVAFSTGARLWNDRLADVSPETLADALAVD